MQGIGTGTTDLSGITTFLFDLDGVMWRGETAIEGAVAAVKKLREAGKRCLFCTNNSSRTTAYYVDKMEGMGLRVKESDVLTSSWVTAHYLSGHFTGPFLAYVIGEEGIYTALQKIGARIVPDSDLDGQKHVDCVVVGIDRQFTYEKLKLAQRLILDGALFIATNRDGTFPVEGGVAPGAGSIVAAVEAASGTPPVTVGKPRPVMIELAIQKLGVQPGEVAMVGDRLDTDIVCARRAGITAICVTTGVTTAEAAQRAKGELRPHFIFENLTALCWEALANNPLVTKPGAVKADAPAAEVAPAQPEAEPAAETEEKPVEAEEPAQPEEKSVFTLPADEDAFELPPEETPAEEPEITPVDVLPSKGEGSAWTEDIDKLFDASNETASEGEAPAQPGDAFEFDTAMSVAGTDAPAPPPAQTPQPQTADTNHQAEKPEAESFDWKLD